jgi:hypothetical protein
MKGRNRKRLEGRNKQTRRKKSGRSEKVRKKWNEGRKG